MFDDVVWENREMMWAGNRKEDKIQRASNNDTHFSHVHPRRGEKTRPDLEVLARTTVNPGYLGHLFRKIGGVCQENREGANLCSRQASDNIVIGNHFSKIAGPFSILHRPVERFLEVLTSNMLNLHI